MVDGIFRFSDRRDFCRFHFDSAAGSGFVQPCEAAYLASLDAQRGRNATAPEVTILVMYVSYYLVWDCCSIDHCDVQGQTGWPQ